MAICSDWKLELSNIFPLLLIQVAARAAAIVICKGAELQLNLLLMYED